ncbi:MAG: tetratricopeptide repeat protein [Leptolyngbya sp. SIO4C1]|nr:tetratricopeptide repeat protein [Leptolyngbya sp. SIO4C1]
MIGWQTGINAIALGLAAPAVLGLASGGAVMAASLEEQLRQPVNPAALNQQRDIADQLLRLGRQQAAAGQYEIAIRSWHRAADLYYDLGDRPAMGSAYENIAAAYVQLGNYAEAETAIRRQLAIARDNGDFETQIFAWNNLGALQLQRGELISALNAFEEGLAVAQSVGSEAGMGLSLSNLGLIANAQGRLEAAIDYYEAAGNYRARAGDALGQANTNNNLGDAYLAAGLTNRALGAYRLALTLGRELSSQPTQLQAIDGLIAIYRDRSDWNQVRRYLDSRIALTLDGVSPWQRLLTLRHLGQYYEATGELVSAQSAYQQALAIAQSLSQKPLEGELTNRLLYLSRALAD